MLLFIVIIATAILFLPGITAEIARQSAWMVVLFSSVAGFVALWIAAKLGKRFPGLTLSQYAPIILGKFIGKVLAGAYIIFFLVVNILVTRECSELLVMTLLTGTPLIVINVVIVFISWYSANKGIEVIARMTQFILPLFVFSYVIICVLPIQNANWEKLLPLFEGGIQPMLQSMQTAASWYGEIIVLVMLIPMINKPQEVMKKAIWAICVTALFLTVGALIVLTVLGPDLSGKLIFPFWFLTKTIEYGTYIQRIESLILPLWLSAIIIKSSLFYYLSCLAVTQLIGVQYKKPVFFFTAPVLIFGSTFLIGNTMMLMDVLSKFWPPFGLFFEIGVPFFLLIIAVIRRKKTIGVSK